MFLGCNKVSFVEVGMGKGGRGWNSTEHAVFIERSLLWAEFIAILPF